MYEHKVTKQIKFNWKDLHKKIGQMFFVECSDSDIQEGNFLNQLWFMDEDHTFYLLQEWDVRTEPSRTGEEEGSGE